MRDLSGRVERLERRIWPTDGDMIVLVVPYSDDPEQAQAAALEARGLRPSDIAGRQVIFITSYSPS